MNGNQQKATGTFCVLDDFGQWRLVPQPRYSGQRAYGAAMQQESLTSLILSSVAALLVHLVQERLPAGEAAQVIEEHVHDGLTTHGGRDG